MIWRPIFAVLPVMLGLLAAGAVSAAPPREAERLTDVEQAYELWAKGYILHQFGGYAEAIELFRASIAVHPTPEGHTFLGWSLSKLGELEEAIAECKMAITLDPDYGNPYNDIGVYLIALGRADEAIPWLEKAIGAERYCCYQFPHFNLGHILLHEGRIEEARRAFRRALSIDPDYLAARLGLELIVERFGEQL